MLPFQQGLQETAIAAALLLVASPVHPFLLELEGWRAALMAIHPRIQDPALSQDVGEMFDALDAFLGSSC